MWCPSRQKNWKHQRHRKPSVYSEVLCSSLFPSPASRDTLCACAAATTILAWGCKFPRFWYVLVAMTEVYETPLFANRPLWPIVSHRQKFGRCPGVRRENPNPKHHKKVTAWSVVVIHPDFIVSCSISAVYIYRHIKLYYIILYYIILYNII